MQKPVRTPMTHLEALDLLVNVQQRFKEAWIEPRGIVTADGYRVCYLIRDKIQTGVGTIIHLDEPDDYQG